MVKILLSCKRDFIKILYFSKKKRKRERERNREEKKWETNRDIKWIFKRVQKKERKGLQWGRMYWTFEPLIGLLLKRLCYL